MSGWLMRLKLRGDGGGCIMYVEGKAKCFLLLNDEERGEMVVVCVKKETTRARV